ncbi:NADH-quinone oxidoreductase subunit NuoE [Halanaerobacter jeridensis]|uniref:NADH-quinone oxidoreductase E subunit n=1 Tax=Halanaerobacter jeridensis TaxID=706427 RepID=A0A938XQN0_9FIRM|nr:NADH-quinone oxidoreductase subunit NuoE [Halanaerobacter jeridensis]MBM7555565.1 NADH-quinone oxidoreductase E subunit [Halanaerobacter jeridensis]
MSALQDRKAIQMDTDDKVLEDKYEKIDEILKEAKDKEESLIDILHKVQKVVGYLPREVQIKVAQDLGIPLSEIYSVISFYSLFSTEPKGDYNIEVCMGTACYVKGSDEVLNELKEELKIEPGQVTDDGKFSLETTRCVGACGMAPVLLVNGEAHGQVDKENVAEILDSYGKE